MLTNFDIERICKKLDLDIVGVYSKDELKDQKRQLGGYYINLANSDQEGTHWTFFYIYSDDDRWVDSDDELSSNSDYKKTNALYYDCFGIGMPKEVSEFLKPFKPIPCNNREIQNITTSECGWYCISLHYSLEHKKNGQTYLEDFEKYLEMWNDDPKKNLKILRAFFKPL
jgi:hypothetical protein